MAAATQKATPPSLSDSSSVVVRREAAASAAAVASALQDWSDDQPGKKQGLASLVCSEPSSNAANKGTLLTRSFARKYTFKCVYENIRHFVYYCFSVRSCI